MKFNTHISKADLHGHTVNSDGELTVLEILKEVNERGLDYYAITDHDCLDGADEACNYNKETKTKIIYGIELSTYNLGEHVHILGYFKDKLDNDCSLRKLLEEQRRSRKIRAYKMFDLLEKHFNIVLDRSVIESRKSITRGTIARLIISSGYNYTSNEIFNKLIGPGCPCFLPSTNLSTFDGIKIIHENGGLAVLAHPCLLEKNDVNDIVKMGIDGIEAIYPKTFNTETKYRDIARKNNLIVTAGSDFHSYHDGKHGEIGTCVIKGIEVDRFLDRLNRC